MTVQIAGVGDAEYAYISLPTEERSAQISLKISFKCVSWLFSLHSVREYVLFSFIAYTW